MRMLLVARRGRGLRGVDAGELGGAGYCPPAFQKKIKKGIKDPTVEL